MKLIIVFASFVLAITASTDQDLWTRFKQEHGKTYKSLREEKLRFDIFKSNLKKIEDHNAKYRKSETSWVMGVTQFADLTAEEFKEKYLTYKPLKGVKSAGVFVSEENFTAPDELDWRKKGAVLSVKNQGECGSCWAFSAVAAVEGGEALKHGNAVDLSPQELMDCSHEYKNYSCKGGWMDNAFKYIKDHGISKLSEYPYTAKDGKCKETHNSAKVRITGFVDIKKNEFDLQSAVASVGPVSAGINGDHIQLYTGGIFDDFQCPHALDHGILIVGYGEEDLHQYWIVKNSWGEKWGENGYIRMSRNKFNQCGIASAASYPLMA